MMLEITLFQWKGVESYTRFLKRLEQEGASQRALSLHLEREESGITDAHWCQFVPDTLKAEEHQGIDFYRVRLPQETRELFFAGRRRVKINQIVFSSHTFEALQSCLTSLEAPLAGRNVVITNEAVLRLLIGEQILSQIDLKDLFSLSPEAVDLLVRNPDCFLKQATCSTPDDSIEIVGVTPGSPSFLFALRLEEGEARVLWKKRLSQATSFYVGPCSHRSGCVAYARENIVYWVAPDSGELLEENTFATVLQGDSFVGMVKKAVFLEEEARYYFVWQKDGVWRRKSNCIPEKIFVPTGSLQSVPVLGRSPNGEGVIVYVVSSEAGVWSLHALWDKGARVEKLFSLTVEKRLGQPSLYQGLLVVPSDEALLVYDAWTGTLLKESACFVNWPALSHPFPDVMLVTRKPRERQRALILRTPKGGGFCEIDLDYARLGVRTSQERT